MKFHQFKIRFVENKKIFFGISIAVLLIGVIFNVIFGARLDIQFTGGAIVNYSFTGEINTDELAALVEETTGKSVNVNESTDIVAGEDGTINNNVSIEFAGNDALSLEGQKAMEDAIQEKYPDNGFQKLESDSVDPVNGEKFLLKCLCAVGLAAVLMIIYIAFRFRKIGGWSAGRGSCYRAAARRGGYLLYLCGVPDAGRRQFHRRGSDDTGLLAERYHHHLRPYS